MISATVQSKILHIASIVVVDIGFPLLICKIVDPLTQHGSPFVRSVYVVAFLFFMVSHNGSYEII